MSNTMKIQLDEGAKVSRAHEDDAGLDLYAREDKVVPAHGSAVFDTGVHIQLEPLHLFAWNGLQTFKADAEDMRRTSVTTWVSGMPRGGVISNPVAAAAERELPPIEQKEMEARSIRWSLQRASKRTRSDFS